MLSVSNFLSVKHIALSKFQLFFFKYDTEGEYSVGI